MTLRPILFLLALILSLATAVRSAAGERWKAEIVLNFRGPGDPYGGSEGLLELRLEKRMVVGRFRSSSLVPQTESPVRGRYFARIDPSAARQRISMELQCLRQGFGEIELDGILTKSGKRLIFKRRKFVWTERRSGIALPDYFVARLHRTQDDFDLLTPYSWETVEKFLERVDFDFVNGYPGPFPGSPYRRKVLIPTDENGFWSMPLIHEAFAGGKLKSRSLIALETDGPSSGRVTGAAPTPP